jgi:hypothetical protein
MTEVLHIDQVRLDLAIRRGFRNWKSEFHEGFSHETRLSDISGKTLAHLALGREKSTFYLFDLIMNLRNLGSGFEFSELSPEDKMSVMDQYLFLLDRIRFEYMKRIGWLETYPGEELTLVDLVVAYEQLGHRLHRATPLLSREHAAYAEFREMNSFEREELIRKLIPKALKEIEDQSTTL